MNKTVTIAAAALLATACMPSTVTPPPPRAGDAPQSRPAPPAANPAPKGKQAFRPDPNDTCGASAMQHLVGRPKAEIPVPVDPRSRRVTCTTCPVTMDYRPDRMNIYFDQATGIVREVKCG